VRMGESGCRLRFPGKAFADVRLKGEFRWQHLDRDAALKPLVTGSIHDAHSAATDFALDGVRLTQRFFETLSEGPIDGVSGFGHSEPELDSEAVLPQELMNLADEHSRGNRPGLKSARTDRAALLRQNDMSRL
jgi:hypothetical protein